MFGSGRAPRRATGNVDGPTQRPCAAGLWSL